MDSKRELFALVLISLVTVLIACDQRSGAPPRASSRQTDAELRELVVGADVENEARVQAWLVLEKRLGSRRESQLDRQNLALTERLQPLLDGAQESKLIAIRVVRALGNARRQLEQQGALDEHRDEYERSLERGAQAVLPLARDDDAVVRTRLATMLVVLCGPGIADPATVRTLVALAGDDVVAVRAAAFEVLSDASCHERSPDLVRDVARRTANNEEGAAAEQAQRLIRALATTEDESSNP